MIAVLQDADLEEARLIYKWIVTHRLRCAFAYFGCIFEKMCLYLEMLFDVARCLLICTGDVSLIAIELFVFDKECLLDVWLW